MTGSETRVRLDPQQYAELRRLARDLRMSEEALLNRAINRILREEHPGSRIRIEAWERERRFIEDRMKLGSIPGSRTWTREDLYDR